MGLINEIPAIWSKSGSGSGSTIDKVLGIAEKVTDTVTSITNIFTSAQEHKNVITDYRKASVALPKYYLPYVADNPPDQGDVATIAVIKAIDSDGRAVEDSRNRFVNDLLSGKTKDTFILKNIQESYSERAHIVETFGEDFGVFLTGEKPKVFTYSGMLVNDAYRNWKSSFVAAYRELLRGSRLAKRRLKVWLHYDAIDVEGYILELTTNTDSSDDVNVSFNFQMLITSYEDVGMQMYGIPPTYGGQLGWPLGSSALSRLASGLLTTFIPGLAGSGFESVISGGVDDLLSKFLSGGTNAGISGILSKGGSILGSATGLAGTISGLLGKGAFGAKAATSSTKAPDTSSLLGLTSGAVTGKFGDMVSEINDTNAQYAGLLTRDDNESSKEFNNTTNIVDTTLQPRVKLSGEAESALDSTVSIDEARRLLDQTGQGPLTNIPLMNALSKGDSPDSPYRVDSQKLSDALSTNSGKEGIQKSYGEVIGMVNFSDPGNVQGIKQLAETKKKLLESIEGGSGSEYLSSTETKRLYVNYLQTSYALMGRQH